MPDEKFKKKRIKSGIIIIGGGRLGCNLMKDLPNAVLIESSPTKVTQLKKEFGDERVFHGDGMNPESLKEAGIKGAEAVIITSSKEHVNYKIALAARPFGIPKIMVRVEDDDALMLFKERGMEPFKITHAMSAKLVERILRPEAIHIHEFILPARAKAVGKIVEELDLPDEVNIVSVLRGDHLEVPEPNMKLLEGDVLTVVASDEEVRKLRAILGATLDINPLQRIFVPYHGKRTVKYALREAFILAKYANAEVNLVYDDGKPEHSKMVKQLEQMFKLQNVAITVTNVGMEPINGLKTHLEVEGKTKEFQCKHVLLDCVMIDPEKSTFFEMLLGDTPMTRIMDGMQYPVFVAGNVNPYKSLLTIVDSSDNSDLAVSYAIDIAILFGSKVHVLIKKDEEGEPDENLERQLKYITRTGRLYGLEITRQEIEGNPSLEFVEHVKSKDYDLVVVNWRSWTLKRGIMRRVVEYGPRSVLIIP